MGAIERERREERLAEAQMLRAVYHAEPKAFGRLIKRMMLSTE